MSPILIHTATIITIADGFLMLSMDKKPACNGCAMNKMCGISDCTKDTIKIAIKNSENYSVGEEILLTSTLQKGYLALFFGYICPFIFMVCTLILLYQLHYSDLILGIGALLSLVVYYLLLWFCKITIEKKMTIQIQKKNYKSY